MEDLIALARAPSLTAAAEQRHITQPAFLRRIRALEETLGVELAARNARPARPSGSLMRSLPHIEGLARSLAHLERELRGQEPQQPHLTIAVIHTVAMVHIPQVMASLELALNGMSLEVQAGDRKDCSAAVMTGAASIAIHLESPLHRQTLNPELVVQETIGTDWMRPYIGGPPARREALKQRLIGQSGAVPLITLCPDGALGEVLREEILHRSPIAFRTVATSAFIPAVMSHCVAGNGIAWLPQTLASAEVAVGRLTPVDTLAALPTAELQLNMLRARRKQSDLEKRAWQVLRDELPAERPAANALRTAS
ncbi:MAG: LysR family transcriptional regulator [Pseudomonadota bacterium]